MTKKMVSGHVMKWVEGEGYKYLHRIISEKKLGRKLRTDEHVDHINGDPDDNRPENLRVVSKAKHNEITDRNGGRPKGSKNKK